MKALGGCGRLISGVDHRGRVGDRVLWKRCSYLWMNRLQAVVVGGVCEG